MDKRLLILPFCALLAWCSTIDGKSIRRTEAVPASSYFGTGSRSANPQSEKRHGSDDPITDEEIVGDDSESDALETVTDGDVDQLVDSLFDKSVQP